MPIEPYRESVAPEKDRCFTFVLKPIAWKARMWRAFDNSVTTMMRLDCPLGQHDLVGSPAEDLLLPFVPALRTTAVYLERGASVPLPLPWSVGRVGIDHSHSVVFLHRVLDDPFGNVLATLFRAAESRADVTLFLALYEAAADKLIFAVRDYDIGVGADVTS